MVPFDLEHVEYEGDNSISQSEIFAAAQRHVRQSSGKLDNFDTRPQINLPLAKLQHLFDRKQGDSAASLLLSHCVGIQLGPDDQWLDTDPLVYWTANEQTFLDYACAAGNQIGLHCALPGGEDNLSYVLTIDFKPHLSFGGKYAQLGGDQKEAMIQMAYRPDEDIFIYMAEIESLSGRRAPPSPGTCTGNPRMSRPHARVLQIYCAFVLSEMRDVTATEIDDDGVKFDFEGGESISECTNAL